MNAQSLQTLRRTALACAATAFALGLPGLAAAQELTIGIGTGIAAAERFRAVDNGSADVAIDAPRRSAAASTEAQRTGATQAAERMASAERRAMRVADRQVRADRRVD